MDAFNSKIYKLRKVAQLPVLKAREFFQRKRELAEKIILASELQSGQLLHDPAEDEEPLKSYN